MTILGTEAVAQNVTTTDETLRVGLTDGRTITVPLAWFPRLSHGTPVEATRRMGGEVKALARETLGLDIEVFAL